MKKSESPPSSALPPARRSNATLHRSGAVAQMLQMPVATLRVWERRYAVTRPALSPSGQRLYSGDDVQRLALLKRLAHAGHAIGTLAALDMAQLQGVATAHATHASVQATQRLGASNALAAPAPAPARTWRLAVIGAALGSRLQRPTLLRRIDRPVQLLGPFADAAQAAAALGASSVDALLIHAPHLHEGWLAALHAAAPALTSVPTAVLFGFAAESICDALATAGVTLMRDPQSDTVLAQWLHSLSRMDQAVPADSDEFAPSTEAITVRRWDDAALVDFASRSSTIACECPRHVADLLTQLAQFEAYSAECESRSAGNAELHTYLRRVAALSRARFEAALERVAMHEGWVLPTAAVGVTSS